MLKVIRVSQSGFMMTVWEYRRGATYQKYRVVKMGPMKTQWYGMLHLWWWRPYFDIVFPHALWRFEVYEARLWLHCLEWGERYSEVIPSSCNGSNISWGTNYDGQHCLAVTTPYEGSNQAYYTCSSLLFFSETYSRVTDAYIVWGFILVSICWVKDSFDKGASRSFIEVRLAKTLDIGVE